MRFLLSTLTLICSISPLIHSQNAIACPKNEKCGDNVVSSNPNTGPRMDIVFVIDTTGSMGDEIDVVKSQLSSMVRKFSNGQPPPDARFAIVAYKDRGESYRTKNLDFTKDIKKVQSYINGLEASGGGDTPEDIPAAFVSTLKLSWDAAPNVAKMAFLVGDAGPTVHEDVASWSHSVSNFQERKIQIHPIACSGLEKSGETIYRQMAEKTGGDFTQLTYSAVIRDAKGKAKTVLNKGSSVYVAERELSDDEWKKGADALIAAGVVKEDKSGSLGGLGGFGSGRGGGAAAPSARGMAPASEMRNNLDEEMSKKMMKTASDLGVAY